MSFRYNDILNIPERNLVQQRLTKAYFLKQEGITSVEKKLLSTTIEKMEILAQLIPEKSNISAVVNDTDSYEQVLIIACTLKDNTLDKVADKCIQLIQKHISHQVLLVVEDNTGFRVNVCVKRINQNDKTKLTIDRFFSTTTLSKLYKNDFSGAFFKALDFSNLDKTNLETTYTSYVNAVVQCQAATITGDFKSRTAIRTALDMQHLENIERIEDEITSLASQIKKESQLNKKVQLNIDIQEKRKEISALKIILAQ